MTIAQAVTEDEIAAIMGTGISLEPIREAARTASARRYKTYAECMEEARALAYMGFAAEQIAEGLVCGADLPRGWLDAAATAAVASQMEIPEWVAAARVMMGQWEPEQAIVLMGQAIGRSRLERGL